MTISYTVEENREEHREREAVGEKQRCELAVWLHGPLTACRL